MRSNRKSGEPGNGTSKKSLKTSSGSNQSPDELPIDGHPATNYPSTPKQLTWAETQKVFEDFMNAMK